MIQRWAIVFGSGFKTIIAHPQEAGARSFFAAMYPEHELVSIKPHDETHRVPLGLPIVARKRNKRSKMK